MPNMYISFTPTRAIISDPPSPGSAPYNPLDISLTLASFDRSTETKKTESITLSGLKSSSLYYSTKLYACQTAVGSVMANDGTGGDVTDEVMQMFLESVSNNETFYASNIDDPDPDFTNPTRSFQLQGGFSRSRNSNIDIGKFTYSFTIREVLV
tara:strand:- start:3038 stop:3499 length:462 start_codon:yes stop_codon:yes gene_type:complete